VRGVLAAAVAFAACGRIGFDSRGDGGGGGGGGGDAASDAARGDAGCTLGAFGTPVALGALNTSDIDDSPQISADGLHLYYSSDHGTSSADLWFASRPAIGQPFTAGSPIAELNSTGADETDPTPTADELDLFYTVSDITGTRIFESTRGSAGDRGAPARRRCSAPRPPDPTSRPTG
jgi:hypothetical protein